MTEDDHGRRDHGEASDRSPDDHTSVMQMFGAPARPDARTRSAVLWIALAFIGMFLAMTVTVISFYGLEFLSLITAAALLVVVYALVGALRYRGDDPMAQIEPPAAPRDQARDCGHD